MNSSDKSFETRARALYLEASRQLDPVTAGRLRAARRTALEAAQAPEHHHRARVLLPVGALAAVALAALIIWQPGPQQPSEVTQPTTTAAVANQTNEQDNELPPGADNTDPGLYQNLDFYGWLAANESSPTKN